LANWRKMEEEEQNRQELGKDRTEQDRKACGGKS
jgi:hypothetical protein